MSEKPSSKRKEDQTRVYVARHVLTAHKEDPDGSRGCLVCYAYLMGQESTTWKIEWEKEARLGEEDVA